MPSISAHAERLESLRAEVRRIEGLGAGSAAPLLMLGVAEVDGRLAGGGLAARALHEVAARSPDFADDASATLFLAGVAGRKSRVDEGGQILWALARRDLFAPGLAGAGLGPERLLYAECRNDEEVLAVMEEGLRHGSLSAVIGEVADRERKGVAAALAAKRRHDVVALPFRARLGERAGKISGLDRGRDRIFLLEMEPQKGGVRSSPFNRRTHARDVSLVATKCLFDATLF